VTRVVDATVRQNALSTSVLRPGLARVATPDLSAGFADVDAAKTGAVVVSDASNYDVYAYTTKGKLVATITGLSQPQGLASDTAGSIYIANTSASNILVYKNDYKTLLATYNDANQYPAGVGYDDTTGVVGVTNIISTAGGAGSVSFYAKGKTSKPCVTVSNANFARVYFGGFDKAGDFFVDGENSSGAVVVGVVTGQCKAKAITPLTTSNAISFPGGVEVTPTDEVAIDDQLGPAVYTYKNSIKKTLGKPVSTTPLTGASDPVTFAFTKTATDLWTADAGLVAAPEYAYPKGGSPITTITSAGQPIGVAVTPVEIP
jgi:hypothetical protein